MNILLGLLVIFCFPTYGHTVEPNPASTPATVQASVTTAPAGGLAAQPIVQTGGTSKDAQFEGMQKQLNELQTQMQEMNKTKAAPVPAPTPGALQPPVPLNSKKENPVLLPVESLELPQPMVHPTSLPANKALSQLRPREWTLGWRYSYSHTRIKVSSGSTSDSSDQNGTEMSVEFGRNLSRWEVGGFLTSANEEIGSSESTATYLGALARLNFIENRPGNDAIPYLSGYLGGATVSRTSSGIETRLTGGVAGLGLGVNWFPFSEIFAFNAELRIISSSVEDESTPKITVDIDQTNLNVGWKIYF
ncbi:MAG: FimV family protein [Bdellovibrio sp.]